MKSYTSSVRIENRIGKKMIKVHKHRSEKDEIGFFPVFAEKNQGYENRKDKMQKVVHKRPYQSNI